MTDMDEALRLDYLEAMGITQYVARAPLPGALPSLVQQLAVTELEDEAPASAPARISELLAAEPVSRPSPHSITATATTPAPNPAADSAASVFQCQLAIWTADDLLLLAEAPRLDNQQLALLRNILQAIGRTAPLTDTKQFSWPLAQRKDRSLQAAREHFQGMLDGGLLQQQGLRQILCFGDSIGTLLAADDHAGGSPNQYKDWPVVTVCTLHGMLAEPARKADTWRTLQVLVRT